ncbi:beta-galactosidase [Kitasatospora sp. NBC_00240]|uniref:beta-galactosidase n=1 Tax=Kitasatospora sp. NBC_00240 TaxID=2903567 RepID=UPI0022533E6C|nr:beta-galactosidase [Kitasatospora sp. NBC_00240]MCX5208321.1 beta-galactosidase [Kitasatospora sp. NBC_00240]
MDRRRFLTISILSSAGALAASSGLAAAAGGAQHTFGFAPDGSAFLLDGRAFQIRSGEMHPARIPVQYWRHRIQMAKAMGLNTIAVYVMWNHVEETPGVFDFQTDRRNIEAFVNLCQQEGMWVLLRPGPYICGEWDLGGLPPYLLKNPGVKLRVRAADDPHYMAAVTRYINALAPRVAPLLVANGGPVLMVQVENEYGSYGSDSVYLEEIRQLWIKNGVNGPFYTQDGLSYAQTKGTVVAGGAIGLSGGDASDVAAARQSFPTVPAMSGELYPGWLTHWGESTFQGQGSDISGALKGLMDKGLSFNIYMVHGGTNFGFTAGANASDSSGSYTPDITSYDYNAPITEQGAPTARYTKYRNLIAGYLTTPPPAVPAVPATVARSDGTDLLPAPYASLWDNLPAPLPADRTVNPQPMETYDQNSGFVLYTKQLGGYSGGQLSIRWVHDYATVSLAKRYVGGLYRSSLPSAVATALNVAVNNATLALPTGSTTGSNPQLDILVEGLGRTNFGHALVDRKGILESVALQNAGSLTGTLTGWQTTLLPMTDAFVANLTPRVTDPQRPGIFFRATVNLTQVGDTYLDMSGWTKGVVWVNGRNLGRYWQIGPQQRIYCPAPWLVQGANQIVIFDLHQVQPARISLHSVLSSPVLARTAWRLVYADSQELARENGAAVNAFDGSNSTIWHSKWSSGSDPLPHEIQIDLGARYTVDGLGYLPRQDGSPNGRIGSYEVHVSDSTSAWGSPVATGAFTDSAERKTVNIKAVSGRYVRLRALTEAGNRGPWTSAADISVTGVPAP